VRPFTGLPDGIDPRDPAALRRAFRAGASVRSTAALAPGHVQGNLVVLPADVAEEFAEYCAANRQACPVLARSAPGDPRLPGLGLDFDLSTDLPRYRIWRDGEAAEEPDDLRELWRDDLAGFVLGCSYSFDEALAAAGVTLRHAALRENPPYYRTSIETVPVGRFRGPLIVSMRPLSPADAIRAVAITSRMPRVHGAPVHLGFPEHIGVTLDAAANGADPRLEPGELPVFWACGVTPESALRAARLPFAATHWPGAMAVTDLRNADLIER
jgi:uncharacterized protein YcsI (UPF0317 family)